MFYKDEGFADEEPSPILLTFTSQDEWVQNASLQDKEGQLVNLLHD